MYNYTCHTCMSWAHITHTYWYDYGQTHKADETTTKALLCMSTGVHPRCLHSVCVCVHVFLCMCMGVCVCAIITIMCVI